MSKNDITGDSLRSRELSAEGKANWDLIFGKKTLPPYRPHENVCADADSYVVACPNCGRKSYFDKTATFAWKHRQDYETVDCECGYRTLHHVPVLDGKKP